MSCAIHDSSQCSTPDTGASKASAMARSRHGSWFLSASTINADSPQAYPISAITFLLVWQDACKAGQNATTAKLVKNWLSYALGAGQQVAPQLQYAPLPDNVKTKAQAKVDGLQCNGAAINGAS